MQGKVKVNPRGRGRLRRPRQPAHHHNAGRSLRKRLGRVLDVVGRWLGVVTQHGGAEDLLVPGRGGDKRRSKMVAKRTSFNSDSGELEAWPELRLDRRVRRQELRHVLALKVEQR